MEFFALNGGTLNGTSGVPLVAASADVVATATFTAVGRNTAAMLADGVATGGLVAAAVVIAGAVASVTTGATVNAKPTHRQAAAAVIQGTADGNFFVVRTVGASAAILGTANFVAFPEGKQGSASVTGTAVVAASATQTLPARAAGAAYAEVTAAPYVRRMVGAGILGTATVRPEAKRNKDVDGYAEPIGTAEFTLPNVGIVRRMATAAISGSATVAANPTWTLPGRAAASAFAQVDASATVIRPMGLVSVVAGASVDAAPTRTAYVEAALYGLASFDSDAIQQHAASAAVSSSVGFSATATRYARAAAAGAASAEMVVSGELHLMGDANFDVFAGFDADGLVNIATVGELLVGDCWVDADPVVERPCDAALDVFAEVSATAYIVRPGRTASVGAAEMAADATRIAGVQSDVLASAEVVPAPTVLRRGLVSAVAWADLAADASTYSALRYADCSLAAGVEVVASPTARRSAAANAFTGGAYLVANAYTNIAAMDPPERTMARPFVDRVMSRPFIDREMRRKA